LEVATINKYKTQPGDKNTNTILYNQAEDVWKSDEKSLIANDLFQGFKIRISHSLPAGWTTRLDNPRALIFTKAVIRWNRKASILLAFLLQLANLKLLLSVTSSA
jgi:hypothetical protein